LLKRFLFLWWPAGFKGFIEVEEEEEAEEEGEGEWEKSQKPRLCCHG